MKLTKIGAVRMRSGHGNIEEGHNRHPDDIEYGHRDADAFRAQPVEPAERKFALLLARQPAAAGQKTTPVFLEDLEPTISPAMSLLLVGIETVGQQAMPIARVGVVGLPAKFEQGQAEIGVLANCSRSTSRRRPRSRRVGSGTSCRGR